MVAKIFRYDVLGGLSLHVMEQDIGSALIAFEKILGFVPAVKQIDEESMLDFFFSHGHHYNQAHELSAFVSKVTQAFIPASYESLTAHRVASSQDMEKALNAAASVSAYLIELLKREVRALPNFE
ncbi:hypothetical protein [Thalassospira xiamenensis]|uniref:Uncharacterized protein n=1 Tax=Thalassospira xiamenensis TaxID=220697 RepID=A0A285TS61_9PROT|nr:hypothetical protein [Thalassospira xiamenensis]SOC26298.1 hypothetical protein SAMN05428964_10593 [Thalassospira xiamenensis]